MDLRNKTTRSRKNKGSFAFTTQIQFIVGALLIGCSAQGTMITGLYNTGVDDFGNVLPLHSPEQHYKVSGPYHVNASYLVPIVYHQSTDSQAWVTPPAGSAWIGPNMTDSTWPHDPTGVYRYDLSVTVDLTGHDISQAQIAGLWATDDSAEIWLNGIYTGFNKKTWGFAQLDPFLIQSGFVAGINVLEFRVTNLSVPGALLANPSGLLVAGLKAVDDGSLPMPIVPVPEPSTATAGLLLVAVVGLDLLRRAFGRA